MDPVAGTIEVLIGQESFGTPVKAATAESVPVIVEAVYGLQDVTEDEVIGGAVAAWTATDSIGAPVRVILWPEADVPPPFVEGDPA